jgi:hypothetical protein
MTATTDKSHYPKSLEVSRLVPSGVLSPETTIIKDKVFYRDKSWNNPKTSARKMMQFYHIPQSVQSNKATEHETRVRDALSARKAELSFSIINFRKMQDQSLRMKLTKQRTNLQANSGQRIMDSSLQRNVSRMGKHEEPLRPMPRLPSLEKTAMMRDGIDREWEANDSKAHCDVSARNPMGYRFKLLDRRPDNLWNKYSVIGQKHIRNAITDKVIKMDEEGYRNIEVKENNLQADLRKLQAYKKHVYHKIRHLRKEAHPSHSDIDALKFDPGNKSVKLKFDDSRFLGLMVNDVNRVPYCPGNPLVELMAQKSGLAQSLGLRSHRSSGHFSSKTIQEQVLTDRVHFSKEGLAKADLQQTNNGSNEAFPKVASRESVALKKTVKSIQNFEQRQRMRKSIIRDVNYPRIYLDQIKNFIF